jgi:hypothetical protein
MRYKQIWEVIEKLPKFDANTSHVNRDRIIYFHFFFPYSVFKRPQPYMYVFGNQLRNGYPPRPYHWYMNAYDPGCALSARVQWHDEVHDGD